MHGQRRGAASLFVMVMVALTLAGACRSERETEPMQRLQAALAEGAPADQFRFLYNAAGTRVNDCFEPNRSFIGDVDRQQGLLILRRDVSSPPMAYIVGGRAVLSASLFRQGSVPTPWLTTPGPVDGPVRASLLRALGTGLAGYVVDGKLPPDGVEFARDGIEVAEEVTQLPERDGAQGFALRLDRDAFPDGGEPGESLLEDPTLELWIGSNGTVSRVAVRPGRPQKPSADDLEVGGWTIDYLPPLDDLTVPDLGPLTELSSVDAETLRSPPIETCRLPLTTDP